MTEDRTNRFEQLLEKYRANNLSHEEYQDFILLVGKEGSESDQALDALARKDWTESMTILQKIQMTHKQKSRRLFLRNWAIRGAAALILLVTAWLLWPNSVPEDLVFSTGYGETRNIELPDGSMVLLNANSQIVWAGDWKSQQSRSVRLKGEAFFDVVKTGDLHFEVTTPDIRVDVLGTEFNVRSRGAETNVFLKEGKVRLEVNGPEEQTLEMDPGDFVQYNKEENNLSAVSKHNMRDMASWVDGMLEFRNEPITVILEEFENLYGQKFKIDNHNLLTKRLDLSLPYADWELVKKALEIALDAEFIHTQDTIIVK